MHDCLTQTARIGWDPQFNALPIAILSNGNSEKTKRIKFLEMYENRATSINSIILFERTSRKPHGRSLICGVACNAKSREEAVGFPSVLVCSRWRSRGFD